MDQATGAARSHQPINGNMCSVNTALGTLGNDTNLTKSHGLILQPVGAQLAIPSRSIKAVEIRAYHKLPDMCALVFFSTAIKSTSML